MDAPYMYQRLVSWVRNVRNVKDLSQTINGIGHDPKYWYLLVQAYDN